MDRSTCAICGHPIDLQGMRPVHHFPRPRGPMGWAATDAWANGLALFTLATGDHAAAKVEGN